MLKIDNLTVKFQNLTAVNNFSMEVEKNTIHSLIGPNGAGKTTVFNAIFNLVPYAGDIRFKKTNLRSVPTHARISMGISRTFQNLNIFYSMTVEENIKMGLHSKLSSNVAKDLLGYEAYATKESNERVLDVSNLIGISHLLKAYPIFLPYGTQKLVELGRALVSKPEVILLDEPAAGLNTAEKETMKQILKKIKDSGITILIVEHDMGIVMDISDKVTVMNFGEKIAEGKPEEVSNNAQVIEAYLGVD